jgi:hypothetical protein
MEFKTIKQRYVKLMADHITVIEEDLTQTEKELIEKSWELFDDKLSDIKTLNDEITRISIELSNLKAMTDYSDKNTEEEIKDSDFSGICPTCGKFNY